MSLFSRLFFKPETAVRRVLENVDSVASLMSSEMRNGVALYGSALIDDLRHRNVLDRRTSEALHRELKQWHAKGKG